MKKQISIGEIGLADYGLSGDGLCGNGLASPHKFNTDVLFVWVLSSSTPQPIAIRGIWTDLGVWSSTALWYG